MINFLKAIHTDDVKVLMVPHYETLSLDNILEWGLSKIDVVRALPNMREARKMPR